jgi:hypothetical protein
MKAKTRRKEKQKGRPPGKLKIGLLVVKEKTDERKFLL